MGHPRFSSEQIAERGQALYEQTIRRSLGSSAHGKFLVLDVESGEYELDSDELAAVKRARKKHPGAAFYVLRVGHPTAFRLGRKAVAAPAC